MKLTLITPQQVCNVMLCGVTPVLEAVAQSGYLL